MQEKKRLHFTHEQEITNDKDEKVVWTSDFIVDDGAPLAFCYSAAGAFFDKMVGYINQHSEKLKNDSEPVEVEEKEEVDGTEV